MTDPYMGHDSLVYVTYTVMSLIHYMWRDMTRNQSVMSLIHYEWHDMTSSLLFRTFLWVCVCVSLSLSFSLSLRLLCPHKSAQACTRPPFPPLLSPTRIHTYFLSLTHTHIQRTQTHIRSCAQQHVPTCTLIHCKHIHTQALLYTTQTHLYTHQHKPTTRNFKSF